MTTSEYSALSLPEKEEYWLKALKNKSTDEDLTQEQWEFEWDPQVLYEDENILLEKNYVNELTLTNKRNDGGIITSFDGMIEMDLGGEFIKMKGYEGKTLVDYMRERGFPLTFLTWI